MKLAFKDPDSKKLLASGMVVASFQQRQCCMEDACLGKEADFWFNVGSMIFNPYRPVMLQLHRLGSDEEELHDGGTWQRVAPKDPDQ
eukprot:5535090-Amphidinium_carterae.1